MSRRGINRILLGAIAAGFVLVGPAADQTCVMAQSTSCRSICLERYNQCRIANKGAPSCDTQYQSCLQGCIGPR